MKYLKKFLDLDKMMMIALDNSKTKCENLNCIFMNEEELPYFEFWELEYLCIRNLF